MESEYRIEVDQSVFQKEKQIDRGTRTICYREGDTVFKVAAGFGHEEATKMVEEMQKSKDLLVQWLGEYVVPSKIGMMEHKDSFAIVTEQPFIAGISLKKALEISREKPMDRGQIIDFLEKSLTMYRNTDLMPDIFGRPHIVGWYQVLSTPNVKVKQQDDILLPRLLDVNFARLSQFQATKTIHNRMLAVSIERAIKSIKNEK